VTATERLSFARCRITFQATEGEAGDRNLVVRLRIRLPGRDLSIPLRTLRGVTRLGEAIPVKPPFLM